MLIGVCVCTQLSYDLTWQKLKEKFSHCGKCVHVLERQTPVYRTNTFTDPQESSEYLGCEYLSSASDEGEKKKTHVERWSSRSNRNNPELPS